MRRRVLILATAVVLLLTSLAQAQGGPDLTIPRLWHERVYHPFYGEYLHHVYAEVCNNGNGAVAPPSEYSDLVDVLLYDRAGAVITEAMLQDTLPPGACQLADFDEWAVIGEHAAGATDIEVYAVVDNGVFGGYYAVAEIDETNNASAVLRVNLHPHYVYLPVILKCAR